MTIIKKRDTEAYLDNFLAGKDTPSDSVGALAVSVGPQITLLVDGIVGDPRVSLNSPN